MIAKQSRRLRPFAAALLSSVCVALFPPVARAEVPTGVPVFSNPTAITNSYFPFTPGDVNSFRPLLHDLAARDPNVAVRRLAVVCLRNGTPQPATLQILDGIADDDEEDAEQEKRALADGVTERLHDREVGEDRGAEHAE